MVYKLLICCILGFILSGCSKHYELQSKYLDIQKQLIIQQISKTPEYLVNITTSDGTTIKIPNIYAKTEIKLSKPQPHPFWSLPSTILNSKIGNILAIGLAGKWWLNEL